jgi:tetratricopeptide (TPR) repeat protein
VSAASFDKKAVDFAQMAIAHDPKFAEAHEFLAFLALEDNNTAMASDEAQKALSLSSESLDAMAVLASEDWLKGDPHSPWMDRILKINPVYGDAYATGGHFLEINYRYTEAIDFYRKAIALNGNLWDARSQLGMNLMRIGSDDEAKAELQQCYTAGYRNAETVNSLRLLDTLGDYRTATIPNATLMLPKAEAALLQPYMERELARAMATYQKKYQMTLPGPVRLEVYPNHDDFVVRTLGLPGQGGLLGVTFGLTVAMDGPTARPPGEMNWASTMWHELSHVYVITATHSLVPRWFTEGLAVHEEGAASPAWGDRMTPSIVMALKEKKLLPVASLDRGFVRPEYPDQVLVSYFEAGKICDFVVQKYGNNAILGIIHSYANRKNTAEAIQENLHETADVFDKEFEAWLDASTGNTVKNFDAWKKGMMMVNGPLQSGTTDDAIQRAKEVCALYPEYTGKGNAYELLAQAYEKKGNKSAAVTALQQYRDEGGTALEPLKHLAGLEQDASQIEQAETTLRALNDIYPEDQEIHQRLGKLLLARGDAAGAIREYQAVLALHPADIAGSHYQLAKALNAAHRANEAKDQILLSLEAAPDYKPAQQLLLQLSQ